jgi:hypothetical protein
MGAALETKNFASFATKNLAIAIVRSLELIKSDRAMCFWKVLGLLSSTLEMPRSLFSVYF